MPGLKKIDYRQLDKEPAEEPPQQAAEGAIPTAPIEQVQQPEREEKGSFFGSLANRLSLMSKKEKIELLVLVVVIAAIIAVAVYYFSNKRPKFNLEESYSMPAVENWQEEP